MQIRYSDQALKSLVQLPDSIQRQFYKQVRFLGHNLLHPSLRAKKYHEPSNLWQARVNRDWRFYFSIEEDIYYIHDIIPHPK